MGKIFGCLLVFGLCILPTVLIMKNDINDIQEVPKNTTSNFSIIEYNGHSYIRYVETNYTATDGSLRTNFQLIHNPDCNCTHND